MNFTDRDIKQIEALGTSRESVEFQHRRFVDGFPDIKLSSIVSKGNGLSSLSPEELDSAIELFDKEATKHKLVKFVPASGAASRMFKLLYNYLEGAASLSDSDIQNYFKGVGKFAFSDELIAELGPDYNSLIEGGDKSVVERLLSEKGLSYGTLPKALLTFHKYEDGTTTKAIDEHLIEGAEYCVGSDRVVSLHFTVSVEHLELIEAHLNSVVSFYETKFKVKYDISFSVQDISTNTLAVQLDNTPFRTESGDLLFRPGGHGALLKNLSEIDSDIIFIKNIDNVAAGWLLEDTVKYKKALGGTLLKIEKQLFDYCKVLEGEESIDDKLESEIVDFLESSLGYKVTLKFNMFSKEERRDYIFSILNRPTRVCGVVKSSNTGGGPFWVLESDGSETLQLVETDQINREDGLQQTILGSSRYANITDLVCGVKNYRGERFNLMDYSDPDTGFISQKSLGGESLKAMELPGLWNGAMSNWNTMFVEVSITTFNPVKTVLDLLKPEHQGVK